MHTQCQNITFLLMMQDLILLDKIILRIGELLDLIAEFSSIAIKLHLQPSSMRLLVLQHFLYIHCTDEGIPISLQQLRFSLGLFDQVLQKIRVLDT